ncbi:MerR family transcriptional regulator [Amycolatopsis magusensis]|uniref:MerR family transcriptional regulator n=1 Tax=Amycolatopsis magusensis TaxID=882444 RepID=UPI0024A8951D|nr:MerR family transcriptional regulator [Amycolatopsis magusensis]MDI5976591.1 MerR family transcriptional regulator [Amycolatopsis magusensis]
MKSSTFSVGDLASRFGLPANVLRHWETEGLLTPERTAGGQRRYRTADVVKVVLILQGKELGFSLGEIRRVLTTEDPADRRAALRDQHAALTRRITEAETARDALSHALACTSEDFLECEHFRGHLTARIPPG